MEFVVDGDGEGAVVLWHVDRAWDFALPAAANVQQADGEAKMKAEVLGDQLAHVDAGGLGAEDADLEGLGVHQAHGGGS